jgi:hypothetical protein
MKKTLKNCHPERGLIFALKREDQPQSKDPDAQRNASADSEHSHEKLT